MPAGIDPTYGHLPLNFEVNRGQADGQVQFLSRGNGYDLFLTSNAAVLALAQPAAAADASAPQAPTFSTVRMQFLGANAAPQIVGQGLLASQSNYLVGSDPTKWLTNVPQYAQVEYQNIYPGVNLVYHGNPEQLQYDFTVAAGADPGQIQLSFDGADQLSIDGQGNLVIQAGGAQVVAHAPFLYQDIQGTRQAVTGHYVLQGPTQVGFAIGSYDPTQPLVIDPTLTYATYLGGNSTDYGLGIAVDSSGNTYLTGLTSSSAATFGPTTGAFQTTLAGSTDVYVTKLNAAGTARLYSTYIGGTGDDRAFGVAVDASGNAYVTGWTASTNFPTTAGAPQTTFGGGTFDGFVTKLNAAGNALVYSTYLGGNGDENASGIGNNAVSSIDGAAIAVDSAGNAWLTGMTTSTNFPTVNAFQTAHAADSFNRDAFVTRVNAAGTAFDFSSYLGGTSDDRGQGIAVDSSGKAYVTGAEVSATGAVGSGNFPTTTGAFQTTNKGSWDVYVAKIDPTLTGAATLVYSTLLGSNIDDYGQAIAVDSAGNAYVTGLANGSASVPFPTTTGAFQTVAGGSFAAFVTKVNPAGSGLVYSTFLSGGTDDRGQGIAVDSAGNAVVVGVTASSNFPVASPIQAS